MKKILFTKYSNERASRFSIRTSIIEEDNRKYVEKTAVTEEADTHILNMQTAYEKLSKYYKGTDIEFSRCRLRNNTAVFDFIEGEPLTDRFENCLEKGDYKGILKLYEYFENIVMAGKGLKPFVKTEKFKEVFGDVSLPEGLRARDFSNIDLVFENILLGKKKFIIDYEWSFDFPVPVEYIMFRSVFTFLYARKHTSLIEKDLLAFLGFSENEKAVYSQMEENFQKFVFKNSVPLSSVYDRTRGNNFNIGSVLSKYNESPQKCFTQVYFDLGKGYNEEDSYGQFYEYNKDISVTIDVDKSAKKYRIDPSCVYSLVNVKKCVGVKDGGIYDLNFTANGYKNNNTIVYDTADPQIEFSDLRENTDKIQIVFNVLRLDENSVEDYARTICEKMSVSKEYEKQSQVLMETEQEVESQKNQILCLKEENSELLRKGQDLKGTQDILRNNISSMKDTIESLNNQIAELKECINDKNSQLDNITAKLNYTSVRLNNAERDYNAVINSRIWKSTSGYRNSINSIKKYIGTHKWTLKMYLVYRSLKVDGIKTTLHRILNSFGRKKIVYNGNTLTNTAELRENVIDFNTIKPLSKFDKKIAIHLHLYYVDLLGEFFGYFENMPYKFDLFVSCKEGSDIKKITSKFKKLENVNNVDVRYTINRGRDIAPLYVQFGAEIEKYDYFLHIHSKKSLYSGSEQLSWRQNSMNCLLGSPERVKKIFNMFEGDLNTGIVCPETSRDTSIIAPHWLQNVATGRQLLSRMGIPFTDGFFSYPIGSFFWARTDALRPVFDLKLKYEDFPQEAGQTDGTLAHALERVIAFVCKNGGYNMAMIDDEDNAIRLNRSLKPFYPYFGQNVENVSEYLSKKDIITFDVFDTLITRLIYNPDDIFRIMERKILKKYNIKLDYLKTRKQAEAKANEKKGAYCNINDIYEYMPKVCKEITVEIAEDLKNMEISLEMDLCIPRKDMLSIFNRLKAIGKKIILISDMYLTEDIISQMLNKCGYSGWDEFWLSCNMGKRKDNSEMWLEFFAKYGEQNTVHIGDNAHSDIQLCGDLGNEAVLVLNPRDAFKFSSYYSLFSQYINTTVENSIMLGTVVNGYLYNSPFSVTHLGEPVAENIQSLGAVAFGAMFVNFANKVAEMAKGHDIWFLAREGYVLKRVYDIFVEKTGCEKSGSEYFLTSRRSISVPAIESVQDIRGILDQYYEGSFSNLMKSRLGINIADYFSNCDTHIVMGRDLDKVMGIIEPCIDDILKKAKDEKQNYMEYINSLEHSENPYVVDVGYSGTIQYYLSKMLNKKIGGIYLSTMPEKKPEKLGCVCHSLYPLDNIELQDENPVFKNQLFLEAVLKAPFGQLMCFKDGKPVYGEDNVLSSGVCEMQEGVFEYVSKVSQILRDIGIINTDNELAKDIFDIALNGDWWPDDAAGIFDVQDNYCSNGNLQYDPKRKEWVVKKV